MSRHGSNLRKSVAGILVLLLAVGIASAGVVPSTRLTWTAPGDDALIGKATTYSGRYWVARPDTSTAAAFAAAWAAGRGISGFAAPKASGAAETLRVAPAAGFSTDTVYFFAVRAADEVGNTSGPSNIAWFQPADTIPPSPPASLKILP